MMAEDEKLMKMMNGMNRRQGRPRQECYALRPFGAGHDESTSTAPYQAGEAQAGRGGNTSAASL
jgi:hypothetical protein